MKTLISVIETVLAIPLSLITLPFLLAIFVVKAIKGKPHSTATVIRMDNSPTLTRHAG